MKKTKTILTTLAVIALLAVAFFSFAAWSCNSPAVPLDDLNRIQAGMTKDQVEEILGKPDEETSSGQWWYKSPLKWYALRIDFTPTGEVIRYIHDD